MKSVFQICSAFPRVFWLFLVHMNFKVRLSIFGKKNKASLKIGQDYVKYGTLLVGVHVNNCYIFLKDYNFYHYEMASFLSKNGIYLEVFFKNILVATPTLFLHGIDIYIYFTSFCVWVYSMYFVDIIEFFHFCNEFHQTSLWLFTKFIISTDNVGLISAIFYFLYVLCHSCYFLVTAFFCAKYSIVNIFYLIFFHVSFTV